ncbi:helix-turn-helix transcriptional regulator [Alsobacter sp. SYSU BS001988]
MSFAKADQLLELATLLRAHRAGLTLAQVEREFGCSRRTAQRMLRQIETRFPDVGSELDDEGFKRWRMPTSNALKDFLSLHADELAALDFAIADLMRGGQEREGRLLETLKCKILALVPGPKASRLATDHDALLEAQGFVARPGPRPRIDANVALTVSEAIKACVVVEIDYQGHADTAPRRRAVTPYGLLAGARRYLIARPEADDQGPVRTYRMDQISAARLTGRSFVRPRDFDLTRYANRAFGLFQNDSEFGEVVWKFAPHAAEHARGYQFHPSQKNITGADGSLTVRFWAAGFLEMAWHLYQWGDAVEVLAPQRLREMVAKYRHSDFDALP